MLFQSVEWLRSSWRANGKSFDTDSSVKQVVSEARDKYQEVGLTSLEKLVSFMESSEAQPRAATTAETEQETATAPAGEGTASPTDTEPAPAQQSPSAAPSTNLLMEQFEVIVEIEDLQPLVAANQRMNRGLQRRSRLPLASTAKAVAEKKKSSARVGAFEPPSTPDIALPPALRKGYAKPAEHPLVAFQPTETMKHVKGGDSGLCLLRAAQAVMRLDDRSLSPSNMEFARQLLREGEVANGYYKAHHLRLALQHFGLGFRLKKIDPRGGLTQASAFDIPNRGKSN
jgi:hypothetical protein